MNQNTFCTCKRDRFFWMNLKKVTTLARCLRGFVRNASGLPPAHETSVTQIGLFVSLKRFITLRAVSTCSSACAIVAEYVWIASASKYRRPPHRYSAEMKCVSSELAKNG